MTHLVLDLDPPEGESFAVVVRAARLVRQALDDLGLAGAVKTSGAKGLHVFVPIDARRRSRTRPPPPEPSPGGPPPSIPSVATTEFVKDERGGRVFVDSTRVGGATVIAAYSPRVRPGVPVSFPVGWDELDDITPGDFTVHTALDRLGDRDPWAEHMPEPQPISAGARRGGRRHPRRPGGRDARGQAPRPRSARPVLISSDRTPR